MYHLVDNFQTKTGDALVGYYVKLKDSEGAYATLYSDTSLTPISTVSGVADTAVTDATGLYDIYVDDGSYDLEFFDKNDISQLVLRIPAVPMYSNTNVDAAETQTLATLAASGGSALIGKGETTLSAITPLTPEQFGAVGDGATDDYEALQAAVDALSASQPVLYLGAKTYRTGTRLEVSGKSGVRIIGEGTIKATDDMPVASNEQVLFIDDCDHFLIDGITVDGNSSARTPAETAAHTVELRSCHNYTLSRVRAINAVCDNFYLSCESAEIADFTKHNYDALFIGCEADNGYRQGLSMIQGRNITFIGCSFTATDGTAPQAGVDLEPNTGDSDGCIRDITFDSCRFEGNTGYGLLVASAKTPRYIRVKNCLFKDNVAGGVSWQGYRGVIEDCTFDGYDGATATRGVIDVGANADAGWLDVVRCAFVNITNQTTTSHSLLYVHSGSGGNSRLVDTHECAVSFIANLNGDYSEVIGGKFSGCASGAVTISEPYCKAIGIEFDAFAFNPISISDNYCEVRGCIFRSPTSNNSNGIIRGISGTGVIIEGNVFRQTSAAGYCITVASGMTVDRLQNNTIDGFTGTPITNAGTITVDRANLVNGSLRTETAIAP